MTLPPDLHVLARGWMHGNVVVLKGAVPSLIDSGYHTGTADVAAAYAAHVGSAVEASLARIALTHTHSDHGGGVAWLQARTGAEVVAHVDTQRMVDAWDTHAMWLDDTGQQMPRFRVDRGVEHGALEVLGDRTLRCVHTPGHATGGVSWFDEHDGILVSGDALWESGFGILNPWADGPHVFDDTALALDRIAELDAAVVIPGHGAPFADVERALAVARSRLDHLHRHPDRLQVLIIRSCAGFLKMARPELDPTELRTITTSVVRSLGLPEADIPGRLAEALPPAGWPGGEAGG